MSGTDTFERLWALDDIHILRTADGHGDGRTVEAYAAVFDSPYEVKDQYGHYNEVIDRTAFNRTLSHGIDRVSVYYHHGMTIHGTPSDAYSVPIGRALEIRPDKRGLLTITRYNEGVDGDRILDAIRNGALRGYSFRGRIIRSSPNRPPRVRSGAALPTWRHQELGLGEYGPTPSPMTADAGILALRSAQVAKALGDAQQLLHEMSTSTPATDPGVDPATPANAGLGTEDPPDDGHSGRLQRHLQFKLAMRTAGVQDDG